MIRLKRKAPRASKRLKKYEEKLFVWFTASILLLVFMALGIFLINRIETKSLKDNVAAMVNGEKITIDELDQWYKLSVNPAYRDAIKKEDFLAESLIPQKLLLQEAQRNKIKADKEEVENAFGEFLIDSGLSQKEFEKKLSEDGLSINDVKEAFKQQILIDNFIDQHLLSKIYVSDAEISEISQGTTSLDPLLSQEEIRKVISEQLLLRKKTEALQIYIKQLTSNAQIQLFANDEKITSFLELEDEICRENDKPVIRLYTSSWCEPCKWVKNSFDGVMRDYMKDGKIAAYHWDLDTGDNTLTEEIESGIPKGEMEIFKKYNQEATVPTYVFGCKYVRIGNFYEKNNNLDAEEQEFIAVVEKLLQS